VSQEVNVASGKVTDVTLPRMKKKK
jgi:hypothetical protein